MSMGEDKIDRKQEKVADRRDKKKKKEREDERPVDRR